MKLIEVEEGKFVNPELVFSVTQNGNKVEIASVGNQSLLVTNDIRSVVTAIGDKYTLCDCLQYIHDNMR